MALLEEFEKSGNWLFRHRSYLPLIILVFGFGLFIYENYSYPKTMDMLFNKYKYEYICLAISILGLIIRINAVGYSQPNTSGRNTSEGQVADEINQTGLYSLVRHPLYLGNFFMWLGVAMLTANPWFILTFILTYWVYYERIIFAEEQFLRAKFKEKYTEWVSRTPAFIPRFRKYIKPAYRFNWKKVLRQEKTVFLLFLPFSIFRFTFNKTIPTTTLF
ncbi:MAG TPA: isoprenylcysteine carboxylmethyltransferase family protein [Salinivirgaceae bacterium]|nr:isoprenylcysteine carboxylmethyltransferase family protein [Salinivirgaceae bacterium]